MIEYYSPQNEAIKIAQNTTEYASNNSTTLVDDTTSFYNIKDGSLVQSFTPLGLGIVTKYIQFAKPIQQSDSITIELSQGGVIWRPLSDFGMVFRGDAVPPTMYIGCSTEIVSGDPRKLRVLFFSRPNEYATWATYNAIGLRWRVRKVSAGNLSEVIAEKQTVTVTGNYSLPVGVKTVNVNASTATITINGLNNGEQVTVRKISAYNGSAVTITPPSGATFEGRASISLYGQYSYVELERISSTVFAVKDLKDEYVWDSGTGAKVWRRWGQLSEKEIIGITSGTVGGYVTIPVGIASADIRCLSGSFVNASGEVIPFGYLTQEGTRAYNIEAYIFPNGDLGINTSDAAIARNLSCQFKVVVSYREW